MPSYQFKINGVAIRGGAKVTGTGPAIISCVSDHPIAWWSINWDGGDNDGNNVSSVKIGDNEWRYEQTLAHGSYTVRTSNHGTPEVIGGTEGGWIVFDYLPPTASARWNGTISDNGSVAANVADARKLGFDTMRLWFNWTSTSTIATANAYVAAGMNVIVCFTPPQNLASVDYPAAAIAAIVKPEAQGGLSRKVIVQIINEANHESYWPGGRFYEAFEMAHRIAGELKPAGFVTASPSFTTQWAPLIKSWIDRVEREGTLARFDYIDGHNYPVVQPWDVTGSEAVANFKEVAQVYRDAATRLGKKCMCSEWGMYNDKDKFPNVWPQLDAIIKQYTDASAYFIMREIPKHAGYGLHLIDAAGNYTALGNAVKAVAQS